MSITSHAFATGFLARISIGERRLDLPNRHAEHFPKLIIGEQGVCRFGAANALGCAELDLDGHIEPLMV